jgi:hypothetical protein
MTGTTLTDPYIHLHAISLFLHGAVSCPGEFPGLCEWVRIPTRRGFVAVYDAQELGEHGFAVQAFQLDRDGDVTFSGPIAWVSEHAPAPQALAIIRDYLASPELHGPGSHPRPSRSRRPRVGRP